MAKQETLDLALVLLDEFKAATGAERAFTVPEVREAWGVAHNLGLLTARLERLAVRACNEERNEDAIKADERLEARLEAQAAELVAPYAVKLKFGGDPRGFVVKVMTPQTGRFNSMGGASEGWGVPT